MSLMSVRSSTAVRWFLMALFMLGAGSCGDDHPKPKAAGGKTKMINCDQSVDVDAAKGIKKWAAYLCDGDTLTWNADSTVQFTVLFEKTTPFANGGRFDNGHPTGNAQPQYGPLAVYKYTITVNGKDFDPQVVAGGNP